MTFNLPDEIVVQLVQRARELGLIEQQQERPEDDCWLDSKRAAAYLSMSLGRLHNLTSLGAVPHYKEGGRLIFRRSELDEWITSGRAAA